jgi:putative membrane protein
MKKKLLAALAIVTVACFGWMSVSVASGSWDDGKSSELSPLDAWYLQEAQHTNAFEIAAGQLAVSRSTDADVREYATMLVADHQLQAANVAELAARKSVPVALVPSPVQAWVLERLSSADPLTFDYLYVTSQIGGHQEAITLTTKESNWGSDRDVRSLAQAALPVLQGHLAEAKRLTP